TLKSQYEASVKELKDKDLATDKAIADLDAKYLAEVEKLVKADTANAQALATLKSQYEASVKELKDKDLAIDKAIADLDVKYLEELEKLVDGLNAQALATLKSQFEASVKELKDKDLATDKAIADLDAKYLAEVEKLVNADTANAQALATLKSQYEASVKELKDKDLATDKAIADLDAKYLAEVEKLVKADTANAQALATLKSQYEASVKELKDKDLATDKAIADLDAKYLEELKALEDSITAANNQIIANKAALEIQISDLKAQTTQKINALQALIDALESTDNAQNEEIEILKQQVEALLTETYYTVTFNTNGGGVINSQYVAEGKKVSAPQAPTKTGCVFDGWYYGDERWLFDIYPITGNITLTARWTACGITEVSSGLLLSGDEITVTVSNDQTQIDFTGKIQIQTGCTWGVYADSECTVKYQNNIVTDLAEGLNRAYVLVECENSTSRKYAVKINRIMSVGYQFSSDGIALSYGRIEQGQKLDEYTAPQKAGYEFTQWEVYGEAVSFPYTVTEAVVFEAVYTPITYTITYVLYQGEFTVTYPTTYNVETNVALRNPTKADYTFIGWYETPDFSGERVFSIEKGSYGDKIFYARWKLSSEGKYAINYNFNGATVVPEDIPTHLTEEDLPLTLTEVTKDNCTFDGWYETPDFSTTRIYELTEARVYTLYARWIEGATPGLVYNVNAEGTAVSITGYTGSDVNVSIPDYYHGLPVTTVADSAFKNKGSVRTLRLPKTLLTIANYAFSGCAALTAISIPNSVTTIGNYAFDGCYNAFTLTIGDSVKSIGDYAFRNCSTINSIKIPDSVTSIGPAAFYNCIASQSVVIGDSVTSIGNAAFCGCNSLTSVVIGDSVTSIGERAFLSCGSLTSVVIGDSVTSIGSEAFEGCSSLTSVIIPDSVTSIGFSAFYDCDSLKEMTLPFIGDKKTGRSYSNFGYIFGIRSYDDQDSYVPKTLERLFITGGTIGSDAFCNCDSLTSVVIGDSVTSIGSDAFWYCDSLTSVIIGNSVTSISSSAFYGCKKLTIYCE
ncbi:MAG: leucine-rich repeat protein, partial [Clostridia bacterium]|nr:leucine-rich repeat protein [Clostridia bacterium]